MKLANVIYHTAQSTKAQSTAPNQHDDDQLDQEVKAET